MTEQYILNKEIYTLEELLESFGKEGFKIVNTKTEDDIKIHYAVEVITKGLEKYLKKQKSKEDGKKAIAKNKDSTITMGHEISENDLKRKLKDIERLSQKGDVKVIVQIKRKRANTDFIKSTKDKFDNYFKEFFKNDKIDLKIVSHNKVDLTTVIHKSTVK
jgi:translation initiation factor IF-3